MGSVEIGSMLAILVLLFFFTITIIFILLAKVIELQKTISRLEVLLKQLGVGVSIARQMPPANLPPVTPLQQYSSCKPVLSAIPVTTPAPYREKSEFEKRTEKVLKKCWNWLCAGEEFRPANVSPEYAAVTTWLIRGGILLLLLAGIFFLKYSFEKKIFTPWLTVSTIISFGCIAAAVGTACAGKSKYRMFFLGIAGGGFALVYAGIFAGFRLFGLYSSLSALSATAVLTVCTIFCAWRTNGAIIALTGCLGGYIAPEVLSGGSSDMLNLFLWLTVLNCGMMFVAYLKNWTIIRGAVFVLYCVAAGLRNQIVDNQYWGILCCSTVNWLVFLIPPALFLRKIKKNMLDYCFWTGMLLVWILMTVPQAESFDTWYKLPSLLMLFSAIVNGICRYWAKKHGNGGEHLFAVFTALSLIIAAGLAFEGIWLPALWSLLAVGFAFEGRRSVSRTMGYCSMFLLVITLFTIPVNNENSGYLPNLFDNLMYFMIHGLSILSVAEIMRRSRDKSGQALFLIAPVILFVLGGIYLFVYCTMETWSLLDNYLPAFKFGGISVLWGIVGLGLVVWGIFRDIVLLRKTGTFLFVLTCLKVLLLDIAEIAVLWKIVCCVFIGIILLTAAVVYIRQRKRFLVGDADGTQKNISASSGTNAAFPSPAERK